tara:strand:- start:26 stop:244 length:219 start_codon:yes stop_codon:yes gene_type:complete
MEYWHRKLDNKLERLEKEQLKKHPELLGFLESKGYVRVNSETDLTAYKKPVKKASVKKVVKKVAKKVTKKKK